MCLFAGAVILPAAMIARKGGVGPLLDAVREAEPAALDWTGEMSLFTMIGLALGVGLKFVVEKEKVRIGPNIRAVHGNEDRNIPDDLNA